MTSNSILKLLLFGNLFVLLGKSADAQTAQWRLFETSYSPVDPDGAGPARGVVQFQLQIRAVGSNFTATDISTGFSWNSTRAMIPTTAVCTGSPPANIAVSPAFAAAGYQYSVVNQCNAVSFTAGGQSFDRIASGTLDPGSGFIVVTTATWIPMFTVTLWALGVVVPEGGYAAVHSSGSGTPGPLGSYAIADNNGNEITVNSVSYSTPLPLASNNAPLPVLFTKFDAQCQSNNSVAVSWATSQETNSSYFEVEKSINGVSWTSVAKVSAAGTASTDKNYQVNDPQGGAAQYRLKQVDKDGKSTYSATVKSSCESRNTFVTLYPVPARDVVTLIVGADKAIKTSLQVFDTKGQMVVNMPVTVTVGTNNFRIPLHKLAAGEYILRSNDSILQISKRFTIIR